MGKILLTIILLFLTMPAFAKIQQTTWSPDTCGGCVVVYEWDDAVPQEQRTHTAVSVKNTEPDFANDIKEVQYSKILEENQRKNKAIGKIKEQMPQIDENAIGFSYDKNHKLHLSVKELSVVDKTFLKRKIDETVGVDKVIIE